VAVPPGERARALDPDDVLLGAREFLLGLSPADKLTFLGASTMFLACFFPWKETEREGQVLGLMSLGVVVFLLSLGALALVVLRSRRHDRRANPLGFWVLQLGAIGAALLVCVVDAVASHDNTLVPAPLGHVEVWVSRPTFGVVLAFLAGLVAGLGTLLGLREGR
jgi:amino acid transporter